MQDEKLDFRNIWAQKLFGAFYGLDGYLGGFDHEFEYVAPFDMDKHQDKMRHRIRSKVINTRPDKNYKDILDFGPEDIALLKESCFVLEDLSDNLIKFLDANELTKVFIAYPDEKKYDVEGETCEDSALYCEAGIECTYWNNFGILDFQAIGMCTTKDSFYLYFDVLLPKSTTAVDSKE